MPDTRLTDFARRTETRLADAGIDNPELDARLLIAHALRLDRAQLLSQPDRVLTAGELQRIELLIGRRVQREPIARILGMREFWSLSFGLNEATLDPRPESETLIEATLDRFSSRKTEMLRILDLGTGSGCLLIALLHEWPHASGLGVDCAPRAVEQARENAAGLGLAGRAEFRVNNWADGIDERFDIVVSNPPYITSGEISTLMPEVRDYDPARALDGGVDGLDIYRFLIPQLPDLLKPGGAAVFEIGIGQGAKVRALFEKSGFAPVASRQDLGGIERCLIASNAG